MLDVLIPVNTKYCIKLFCNLNFSRMEQQSNFRKPQHNQNALHATLYPSVSRSLVLNTSSVYTTLHPFTEQISGS